MTLTGEVIEVGETVINKDFAVKKFVVKTDQKKPQEVPFELYKDNCDFINSSFVGSKVEVDFYIKANKWQDRRFVTLVANKIEETDKSDNQVPYTPVVKVDTPTYSANSVDELPF